MENNHENGGDDDDYRLCWPNKVGLKCPSIRPSVHKTFLQFQRNLVCRQRSTSDACRYAVWPDPRSWAHESQNFRHFQRLSPPLIYHSCSLCIIIRRRVTLGRQRFKWTSIGWLPRSFSCRRWMRRWLTKWNFCRDTSINSWLSFATSLGQIHSRCVLWYSGLGDVLDSLFDDWTSTWGV